MFLKSPKPHALFDGTFKVFNINDSDYCIN